MIRPIRTVAMPATVSHPSVVGDAARVDVRSGKDGRAICRWTTKDGRLEIWPCASLEEAYVYATKIADKGDPFA